MIFNMEHVNELAKKLNNEVAKYFGLPLLDLNIHNVRSRDEFDKLLSRKTENWMVGLTRHNDIYILEKDKFDKESIHPKPHYDIVLKHEISHIYFKQLKPDGHPNWLDEGTAFNVANQKSNKPKEINLKILKKYYRYSDEGIYEVGYFMVEEILINFGKDKLFELIRLKSSQDLYKELQTMFSWLNPT
jgi:hypothetical protein